jgi:phosphatidylglycerophosphate synthase
MLRAARAPIAAADDAPPLQRWLFRHALVMLVGAVSAAVLARGALLALPAAASLALLWRDRPAVPGRGGGLANALTASRVAAVVLATAAMPWSGSAWVMAAFAFNVTVDAIDGYAARRSGEATSFGAVFDREADALFVLCAYLYFYLYAIGDLGGLVLLPALLPYVYRLGATVLSAPVAADDRERLAAPLAAFNFVLLLAAVALPEHATPILALSLSVVLVSFGPSLWSLCRHAYSLS